GRNAVCFFLLESGEQVQPLLSAAQPRVTVRDLEHNAPMQQQDGVLFQQFRVECLGPSVVRIILVLQGQDEAGVKQDAAAGHGQNLRPVNPSTSSEFTRPPQFSAFEFAQSARLVRGRFPEMGGESTVTTNSAGPVG